ncbi:MAG: FlgD immunoglobulin-like domain containing protein [Fidelibacterota bacterium]
MYDLSGREVTRLVRDFQAAGSYEYIWNGRNQHGLLAPSGIYLVSLETETGQPPTTAKLVLVK